MKKKSAASPRETRRRLVLSGIELACVFFVLCAALTAAWFSIPEDKKHGAALEAGRIRYSLAGEKNEVFIRHFDLDEEDYEDDDQEIETYIPAEQVGIAVNTDPGAAVTALSLQKTTTVKLQALMKPDNATDKITWYNSEESVR